ncbi:hypothetical protein GGS26DRAFT_591927 [Hypomontagnella submonticulosa]|nr:hypothetical protein GGS26DRAFT_591927 [Hypomontagnella submonticulosa]
MDLSSFTPDQLDAILDSPAAPNPSGVPDLTEPPNKNAQGLAVADLCLSLASLGFLIRMYSKIFCAKRVRTEDFLGAIAFGTYIATAVVIITFATSDLGLWVHIWDLDVRGVRSFINHTFLFITLYSLTMIFAKAAILIEWIHVFVPLPNRNAFLWICCVIIAVNTMIYIAGIIATQLACIPRKKNWFPLLSGTCIDRKPLDECVVVINLTFDILILFLPQRVIWKLNLKGTRRAGISIIFSVGLLACACAAGRVYSTFTLDYHGADTLMWGLAEATCVFLVFCIPGFPKAFGGAKGPLARLAVSLRSWTRLSPRSPPGSNDGGASNRSEGSPKSVYERIDERSEIPLRDLEVGNVPSQTHAADSQGKIIRTTEFSTAESISSRIDSDDLSPHQHPWLPAD